MVTPASFSACSVNSISDSPCWARLISGSPLKLNASRQEPVTVVGSADAAPTSLTECSIGVCKCTAHPLLDLWLMFIRLKDSLGKPAVAGGGLWRTMGRAGWCNLRRTQRQRVSRWDWSIDQFRCLSERFPLLQSMPQAPQSAADNSAALVSANRHSLLDSQQLTPAILKPAVSASRRPQQKSGIGE